MNTHFAYDDLYTLSKKYAEVFDLLSENGGEIDEEIEIKLYESEEDFEKLAWEVMQIMEHLDNEVKLNKKRIEGIESKNKSLVNQETYLKKFLQDLIKQKGKANRSGNRNMKLGERSLTVGNKTSIEVTDEFTDDAYIRYEIKNKITGEFAKRIETFLVQKGQEANLEKVILKKELAADLKAGKIVKGVVENNKEYLMIK